MAGHDFARGPFFMCLSNSVLCIFFSPARLVTIAVSSIAAPHIWPDIRGLNTPVLVLANLIRPGFIIDRLAPLYAALILFIARYYLFPLIIGFDVESFTQMPLEKLLLSAKTDLGL